jgi:hypothetical protein
MCGGGETFSESKMAEAIWSIVPTLSLVLNGFGLTFIAAAAYLNVFKNRTITQLLVIAMVCLLFGNLDKFSKFSIFGVDAELKNLVRSQVSDTLDIKFSKIDAASKKTVAPQQFAFLEAYCDPGYKATGISLEALGAGVPVLTNMTAKEKSGLYGYAVEVQNGAGSDPASGRSPIPLQLQVVCLGLKP